MFDQWHAAPAGETGPADWPVTVPGRPAEFSGAEGVRYVTSFEDPREAGDGVAVVALDGLFAHAEVAVTGERVGDNGPVEHHAYFEPLRVPLRPAADTRLSVTCRAPRDRFGGLHDTDRVPAADRVPGIWWEATLESRPLPYVDRLRVRPELTDEGATLHVRTTVVADGPREDTVTYSLRPVGDTTASGTMRRGTVETTGPGKTTVEHTVEVRDPALWWPAGLGDQNRYRLRATLGDSERSVTTGIRTVERDGGRLLVNGEPLRVRGVTLLTDDPADVRRASDLHATLVRAPAHVLSPAVYEACDEAGILVWQGLPLTGPGAFDPERGADLARRLVGARGHHPSLAAVGVHDEPTDAFADALGPGRLDRLRLRWRAWRADYDPAPARRVARAVAGDHPVVPVVGGPGVDHDAAAYYPGWEYGTPADVETLLDRYPTDLLAAFGAGALAAGVPDATDVAGFDAATHETRVADGTAESQAYQAEVVRTVAEAARRRGVGAVASSLRDTDAGGTGVYAADGAPKAARDALAAAFQPVQAFLVDPSPGASDVVVVNDTPGSVSATLAWTTGESSGQRDLTVEGTGRWTGTVELPAGADAVRLSVAAGGHTAHNAYDL
jgi:hypothetical protein